MKSKTGFSNRTYTKKRETLHTVDKRTGDGKALFILTYQSWKEESKYQIPLTLLFTLTKHFWYLGYFGTSKWMPDKIQVIQPVETLIFKKNYKVNLRLPHYRQILYLLSHQGSPFLPMCMVYSCAFLLISYMLDLCVSVWKTFLPDMSYVTGLLKASNELLCIKTLASSYRDRCYFFSLPLTIHCTKHFITLFHMILTVTYNVGNIRILLQTTELEQ